MQNKVQQLEETNNDEKRLNKFSMSLSSDSSHKLSESEGANLSQRVFDIASTNNNNNGNNTGASYSNIGNALNVLENLQSKLKLKEGEIVQLQVIKFYFIYTK